MTQTATPAHDQQSTSFLSGSSDSAYQFLGAHPFCQDGESGWVFRIWAPHAKAVSVAGDFNRWTVGLHPMYPVGGGIWVRFISGPSVYDCYKFFIETADGRVLAKADPFAFHFENPPGDAPKLYDLNGYHWNDTSWLQYRRKHVRRERPENIYQVHLGSWRRTGSGGFLSYRDMVQYLIPYVKEMGFTSVSLLPVNQTLDDSSFGFRCLGYFAPDSRFGTPADFMYFVDAMHQAGIAVYMDWCPDTFPNFEAGLSLFDGEPCFESDEDLSRFTEQTPFCYRNAPVRSFLISSALFWLKMYHLDGLCLNGVVSTLYSDAAAPVTAVAMAKTDSDAASFLLTLEQQVHSVFPDVLLISNEPLPRPHSPLSPSAASARLSFDYQWDTGWAHDMLHYLSLNDSQQRSNRQDLYFSLSYRMTAHYILPLSYRDVLPCYGSLISRIPGPDAMKFAAVRVFYLFMLTRPGKKLLMMGTEFGQFRGWDCRSSLDWHLLDYQPFRSHRHFFRQANQFYLSSPCLWAADHTEEGFRWVSRVGDSSGVLAFIRQDTEGNELLIACNFSPENRLGYPLEVPDPGTYEILFHTDCTSFGGCGRIALGNVCSVSLPNRDGAEAVVLDLPPMSGVILRCLRKNDNRRPSRPQKWTGF